MIDSDSTKDDIIITYPFTKMGYYNRKDKIVEFFELGDDGVYFLEKYKTSLEMSICVNYETSSKKLVVVFPKINSFPKEEFMRTYIGQCLSYDKTSYSNKKAHYILMCRGILHNCICIQVVRAVNDKFLPLLYSRERQDIAKERLDIYLEDLIKETWKPSRLIDWCFDNEDKKDFNII